MFPILWPASGCCPGPRPSPAGPQALPALGGSPGCGLVKSHSLRMVTGKRPEPRGDISLESRLCTSVMSSHSATEHFPPSRSPAGHLVKIPVLWPHFPETLTQKVWKRIGLHLNKQPQSLPVPRTTAKPAGTPLHLSWEEVHLHGRKALCGSPSRPLGGRSKACSPSQPLISKATSWRPWPGREVR